MEHVLQLYQEESCLLDALADFVAAGLRVEEGVVVIGSTPRWDRLLDQLCKAGVDAHAHVARGQLRLLGTHLLRLHLSNRQRFNEVISSALSLARARYERVRVFSELTDALWRDGDRANARLVERGWQPLLNVHEFNLLCACPIDSLEGQAYDGSLQALCSAHTHVRPAFDEEAFEQAVSGAVAEVLDTQLARMLQTLSSAHRPAAQMPPGQAILFWLKDHMPRTAERVMSRARARWSEH
jgi:hypothetical protein